MALIECSECAGQVSDQAEACPHCGMPTETGYRLRAERLRQQRLGEAERAPDRDQEATALDPPADPTDLGETGGPTASAMVLTKPAGVFCQLIGFFTLLGGIGAAANDSSTGVLFAFLGGGLFIWGGWSARQHKKARRR